MGYLRHQHLCESKRQLHEHEWFWQSVSQVQLTDHGIKFNLCHLLWRYDLELTPVDLIINIHYLH